MSVLQSLILGLLQGLTEFLPVSSSGHIEIGKAFLGVEVTEDLTFTVVVHGATVLSTMVIFYKDILRLLRDGLRFRITPSAHYIGKLGVSMIPVGIVGLCFRDWLEHYAAGNVPLVGAMLIVTAVLLFVTNFSKHSQKEISYGLALVIGLAQAVAVMPGISRSGATIATALLLGVKREEATRFSFLMVLVPVIGANAVSAADGEFSAGLRLLPLAAGFAAAFLAGILACKWMIRIVNRGKLIWFALYCFAAGILSLILG